MLNFTATPPPSSCSILAGATRRCQNSAMARPPGAQIGDEMSEASGTPDPTASTIRASGGPTGPRRRSRARAPVPTDGTVARAGVRGIRTPAKRPVVMWDLVLTIVLLVVMIGAGAARVVPRRSSSPSRATRAGPASRLRLRPHGHGHAHRADRPARVGLLALIAAVIVLVLRRLAFWIPIVGIVLVIGVFVGGAALTISGVPARGRDVPDAGPRCAGTQGLEPAAGPVAYHRA